LFEIIFHIHGNGPGSNLAVLLKVGEKVKMAVPGGRKMYVYVPEKAHHFFFGDENSLSFYVILMKEMQQGNHGYTGILEMNDRNSEVTELLGLDVVTVLKTPDTPGQQAIKYLLELSEYKSHELEEYIFYVTGNVASVQAFRKELKQLGVNAKNIKLQGYWVEGSAGL
jgi:NADPH-dependent ferric siderophore reductase